MRSILVPALVALFSVTSAAQTSAVVLVVYDSRGGHTKALAEAIAAGAELGGASVMLRSVKEATARDVDSADAIIVGSPVYNAAVSPSVQEFINSWPFDGSMKDKIGAAFATGGGISAGEELVQLGILRSMLVFGMMVVGGPDWQTAFGASAVTMEPPFVSENGTISAHFVTKGNNLGQRVAQLTKRIKGIRD